MEIFILGLAIFLLTFFYEPHNENFCGFEKEPEKNYWQDRILQPNETFYFGAAHAAHQVEGNNTASDWWEFEEKHLKPRDLSGIATAHYHNFEEDFELAEQLHHNAHRFSIEWSRIEPEEGKELNHYKKVFQSLKKHSLEPILTLFHFSLPLWVSQKGGFENPQNIASFVHYCKLIGNYFREDLNYILTMNEPATYINKSYLEGLWPPGKKNYRSGYRVVKNLITAHQLAYKELKNINPAFQISMAGNHVVFHAPRSLNIFDFIIKETLNYLTNHYFLNHISDSIDFIGLNYYDFQCVKFDLRSSKTYYQYNCPTTFVSDMGWEVYPKGIYLALKTLDKKYHKPILITENGIADHKDHLRSHYIPESLSWVFKAKKEGVQIFGYLHWALTDNFEWDSGFTPRFGLIEIDYSNLKRTIRPSALIYKEIIDTVLGPHQTILKKDTQSIRTKTPTSVLP